MNMKICKMWINLKNPSDNILEWFNNQEETNSYAVIENLILEKEWANTIWFFHRLMRMPQFTEFVMFVTDYFNNEVGIKRIALKKLLGNIKLEAVIIKSCERFKIAQGFVSANSELFRPWIDACCLLHELEHHEFDNEIEKTNIFNYGLEILKRG